MHLSSLKPKTPRKSPKRVGRGGKRGTTSGNGTKGQKSRAGASVRPGFRGGDNRIWQLFPKSRGASSKPGNKSVHRKQASYRVYNDQPIALNVWQMAAFKEGETVSLETLTAKKFIPEGTKAVKMLGTGELNRKLKFEGILFSGSAREKVEKAGGTIQ